MTAEQRKLATFMFTDMVGYSALAQKNDALAAELLAEHRQILRTIFAAHGGQELDAVGDGFLVEFASAVDAARCAIAVQQRLQERNTAVPPDRKVQVRIGLHLGDVVVRDGRAQGDGVNIAARIEPLAEPGGICLSEDVARQIQNKIELPLRKLGKGELKNIRLPVDLYRLVLPWEGRHLPFSERVFFTLRQRRARRIVAASVAVILVGLLGSVYVWQRSRPPVEDPVLALPKGPSIAVLPFTNLGADPKQEYFADGIAEDVLTRLSRFTQLKVIARNSTFQYKGRSVDVRNIGRELGARYVLEGSVRRSAKMIRVTVQLLDAKDGSHIWANIYDRTLTATALLDMQDDITSQIAATIAGTYGVLTQTGIHEIQSKRPESLEAYECVLLGEEYQRVPTAETHRAALDCLQRIVKAEPTYADAWSWLAFIHNENALFWSGWNTEHVERARQAAQRALEIDPANQRARAVLAFVYFWRRERDTFLTEAEKAIAVNPNQSELLTEMAFRIMGAGERDRGLVLVKRALALNPYAPGWTFGVFIMDHYNRKEYQQALSLAQQHNVPGFYWTYVYLAAINGQLGHKTDAQEAAKKLLASYPDYPNKARIDLGYWFFGRPEVVDHWVDGLRKAGLNVSLLPSSLPSRQRTVAS